MEHKALITKINHLLLLLFIKQNVTFTSTSKKHTQNENLASKEELKSKYLDNVC